MVLPHISLTAFAEMLPIDGHENIIRCLLLDPLYISEVPGDEVQLKLIHYLINIFEVYSGYSTVSLQICQHIHLFIFTN